MTCSRPPTWWCRRPWRKGSASSSSTHCNGGVRCWPAGCRYSTTCRRCSTATRPPSTTPYAARCRAPSEPPLRAAYEPAAEHAARLLPNAAGERLRTELDTVLSGDTVDFSYLGATQQAALLRRCGDPGVAHELRRANAALLDAVHKLPHRAPPDHAGLIDTAFGEAPFARRAAALLAPLSASRSGPSRTAAADGAADPVIDPGAVQRAFANPAALRLLMDS